ncbi:MAG: FlgD immunoglobulin-like domain containing protein [Candidatus Eisenbacteria bacterium]
MRSTSSPSIALLCLAASAWAFASGALPSPAAAAPSVEALAAVARLRAKPPLVPPARPLPALTEDSPFVALPDLSFALDTSPPSLLYRPIGPYDTSDPFAPSNAPLLLRGDLNTTRTYYSVFNGSTDPVGAFQVARRLDGVTFATDAAPPVASFAAYEAIGLTLPGVKGGRHTFSGFADPANLVAEASETNNAAGAQWVWRPVAVTLGAALVRHGVPMPFGGLDDVPIGLPAPNCDAFRTPAFAADGAGNGRFGGVAICPQASDVDIDLYLYTPTTGPTDGFLNELEFSFAAPGMTDFALVDADPSAGAGGATGARDAGVRLYAGTPSVDFAVHTTASVAVNGVAGTVAQSAIAPGALLAVYELQLAAGDHRLVLQNLAGGANLDLAIVKRDPSAGGYYNLIDFYMLGQVSQAAGPGGDEVVQLTGATAGRYALVVWKVGTDDVARTASFRVVDQVGTAGVGAGGAAAISRFAGASPNPARGATQLSFVLARDAHVLLAVHDVHGRRVATLASGRFAPGTHALRWDGRDDAGRAVAAGLYFARFEGDGVADSQRVVWMR